MYKHQRQRAVAGFILVLSSASCVSAQQFCQTQDFGAECFENMKRMCDPRFGGANDAQCRRYFEGRPPNYPNNPAARPGAGSSAMPGQAGVIGAILGELMTMVPQQTPQQPSATSAGQMTTQQLRASMRAQLPAYREQMMQAVKTQETQKQEYLRSNPNLTSAQRRSAALSYDSVTNSYKKSIKYNECRAGIITAENPYVSHEKCKKYMN